MEIQIKILHGNILENLLTPEKIARNPIWYL